MSHNFVIGDFIGCNGCSLALDVNGKICIGAGGGGSIMVLGTGCNSTLRCGVSNTASGGCSAALGGASNTASGSWSSVVAGVFNVASGTASTVSNGYCNVANNDFTFVGGGAFNSASNQYASVVGGKCNSACAFRSFVGGGECNIVCVSGGCSAIVGGQCNTANASYSFVGAGCGNTACGNYSFVGGGYFNTASGVGSVVVGGGTFFQGNTASGNYSAVLGGKFNTASATYSAVFGNGLTNTCSCSFLANTLRAADLFINGPTYQNNCTLTFINPSDRTLKCNITASTYGLCELKKLNPVNYKWICGNESCNLGFIAQEVREVLPSFVGENSDKTLGLYSDRFTPLTVKAVQELNDKLDAQEQRIAVLEDILKKNNLL
jgi:hypothetical protein